MHVSEVEGSSDLFYLSIVSYKLNMIILITNCLCGRDHYNYTGIVVIVM
jgi:hypothetical protein